MTPTHLPRATPAPPSTATLDGILALQLAVAWAGEALCEPARLGWWRTDLIDELGGGDLFKRLAPRTHRWAALEAARRAAVLADRKARAQLPDPDAVCTLYAWGFDLDERLDERLRDLKHHELEHDDGRLERLDPYTTLPFPDGLRPDPDSTSFDQGALTRALQALAPKVQWHAAVGRRLEVPGPLDLATASSDELLATARALAAALAPTDAVYVPSYVALKVR